MAKGTLLGNTTGTTNSATTSLTRYAGYLLTTSAKKRLSGSATNVVSELIKKTDAAAMFSTNPQGTQLGIQNKKVRAQQRLFQSNSADHASRPSSSNLRGIHNSCLLISSAAPASVSLIQPCRVKLKKSGWRPYTSEYGVTEWVLTRRV